jgi:hypothetical protein
VAPSRIGAKLFELFVCSSYLQIWYRWREIAVEVPYLLSSLKCPATLQEMLLIVRCTKSERYLAASQRNARDWSWRLYPSISWWIIADFTLQFSRRLYDLRHPSVLVYALSVPILISDRFQEWVSPGKICELVAVLMDYGGVHEIHLRNWKIQKLSRSG